MLNYIADTDHCNEVLARIVTARRFLWIGTADIKDLYMDLPAGQLGLRTPQKLPY